MVHLTKVKTSYFLTPPASPAPARGVSGTLEASSKPCWEKAAGARLAFKWVEPWIRHCNKRGSFFLIVLLAKQNTTCKREGGGGLLTSRQTHAGH